ncbi:hypothetical protein C5167_033033 [Papaver somniferum]|uniref:Uncharacterized protein n=1 Tax=Papaver somniferum TaxID=3469 RepID=A0A4Y7K9A0_PAPSO|nr:hypothetical protein C5167_033033 [Papaver somniferum]
MNPHPHPSPTACFYAKHRAVFSNINFNIHAADDDICGKGTKDSENPIFIPAVSLIPEDACKDYANERIQQVDFGQISYLYFNAERFSASAYLGEVPPMDVEAMNAFVDGYSNFLPRLTLFTLAQQQNCCYKLLKLNRLKAAKLSFLLGKVTDHGDLLITQIEDLKKQVTIGTISFSEEIERLHLQLTLSQESTAAAELSRDEAMRAHELAEQAHSAVDTSFAREATNLIEIQELVASLKKKINDLNAYVIKQTNLAKNYQTLATKAEVEARLLRDEIGEVRNKNAHFVVREAALKARESIVEKHYKSVVEQINDIFIQVESQRPNIKLPRVRCHN